VNSLVGRKNVAVFDERRNTSRVMPVEPGASDRALVELSRAREANADWYCWIRDVWRPRRLGAAS
jgi:hypothetical protein